MNYGFKVKIKWKKDCPYKGTSDEYRNVTEIHFCYPSPLKEKKIAFESNIHSTGMVQPISYIKEFEATREAEKAKAF